MLGDEHFHHGAAELVHRLVLIANHHAVGHRQGAGGRIAALPFDLHHAHPAGGVGLHAGVVAEIWHVDARIYGRFEDHLAGLGRYFHPVYADGDVVGHFAPP